MNRKQLLKNTILAMLPLILIISLISLYINHGFHFTDYHNQIELDLISSNTNNLNNIINSFSGDHYVSHLDRTNNSIFFEFTDKTYVNSKLKNFLKDNKDINYVLTDKLALKSNKDFLIQYSLYLLFSIIVGYIALYIFILRLNSLLNLKDYLNIFILFALSLIFAFVLQLGIISIISRFYEIKSLDLITVFIGNLIIIICFYLSIYKFKENKFTISDFLINQKLIILEYFNIVLKISFLILIILIIGIGPNFIFFVILMISSFLFSFFTLFFFSNLFEFYILKKNNIYNNELQVNEEKTFLNTKSFSQVDHPVYHHISSKPKKSFKKKN